MHKPNTALIAPDERSLSSLRSFRVPNPPSPVATDKTTPRSWAWRATPVDETTDEASDSSVYGELQLTTGVDPCAPLNPGGATGLNNPDPKINAACERVIKLMAIVSQSALEVTPFDIHPLSNDATWGRFARLVYQDAPEFSNYSFESVLGVGTYGIVFLLRELSTQALFACKAVINGGEVAASKPSLLTGSVVRELIIGQNLRTKGLLPLHKAIFGHSSVYLLLPYVPYTLPTALNKLGTMLRKEDAKTKVVYSMMHEIATGLHYMHANSIIHRDLKPNNILVTEHFHAVIADFGLSKPYGIPIKQLVHEVATVWYRAPEILIGSGTYSTATDIWGLGLIFIEILTGKVMLCANSQVDQIFRIFQMFGTPNAQTWPGITRCAYYSPNWPQFTRPIWPAPISRLPASVQHLLQGMMRLNPAERISSYEVLHHPAFQEMLASPKSVSPEQQQFPYARIFGDNAVNA